MPKLRSHNPKGPAEIGWREFVGLPRLQIAKIKAKIDTGARTSALHAVDLETFERDGVAWVSFTVPSLDHQAPTICSAPVVDRRAIKNTSGVAETRHIIQTTLVIGRRRWRIEVSLSDRTEMGFDLILGRSAIRTHNHVVNPSKSFLAGAPVGPSKAMLSKRREGVLRTVGRGSEPAKH